MRLPTILGTQGWVARWKDVFSIAASIATVGGIVFAIVTILYTRDQIKTGQNQFKIEMAEVRAQTNVQQEANKALAEQSYQARRSKLINTMYSKTNGVRERTEAFMSFNMIERRRINIVVNEALASTESLRVDIKSILEPDSSRINLKDAKLDKADLTGAYLHQANLSNTNLILANLRRADLSEADLMGANLSGANLSEIVLIKANLYGANLEGANLEGANLEGANLEGAKCDIETILSKGYFCKDGFVAELANLCSCKSGKRGIGHGDEVNSEILEE